MTRLRQIALVAKDMNLVQTHFYNLFGLSDAHIDPKISKFGLQILHTCTKSGLLAHTDTHMENIGHCGPISVHHAH